MAVETTDKEQTADHHDGHERNTEEIEFNGRIYRVRPGITGNIKDILDPFLGTSKPILAIQTDERMKRSMSAKDDVIDGMKLSIEAKDAELNDVREANRQYALETDRLAYDIKANYPGAMADGESVVDAAIHLLRPETTAIADDQKDHPTDEVPAETMTEPDPAKDDVPADWREDDDPDAEPAIADDQNDHPDTNGGGD